MADRWSPADGAIIHMISTYGHRAESLVRLTISAIDGDSITMPVKSGDLHRHPLLPETLICLRALARGRAASSPLFIGHLNRPWTDGGEFARWLRHCLHSGVLPLRRYAITRLLDATGGDLRTAASITGHRTPTLLLNTYARTNDLLQRGALAELAKRSGFGVPLWPRG